MHTKTQKNSLLCVGKIITNILNRSSKAITIYIQCLLLFTSQDTMSKYFKQDMYSVNNSTIPSFSSLLSTYILYYKSVLEYAIA